MLNETRARISVRKRELKTFQTGKWHVNPFLSPLPSTLITPPLTTLVQVWMSPGDGGRIAPTRSLARRPAQGPPQPATPRGLPGDTRCEKPRCRTLPIRAAQRTSGGILICRYLSRAGREGLRGVWFGCGSHTTTKMERLSTQEHGVSGRMQNPGPAKAKLPVDVSFHIH